MPGWDRKSAKIGRLKLLLLAGAGAAIIAGILACTVGGTDFPDDSPIPATEASLAIGAELFTNNCQICHGEQGQGSLQAPDLRIHVPTRNDGFLFGRITFGFPKDSDEKLMPSFSDQLTETERWHLVNFIRTEFGVIDPVLPDDLQ